MQRVADEFVTLAHAMADAAGEIARARFRSAVAYETKADSSPVTEVDRAVEARLREIVAERGPGHGFIGEEYPAERPDAELAWIVDPIDGTVAFLCGQPTFGTMIALRQGGDYVLGLVDQPITRERWLGADGHGASLNGAQIRTRACSRLADAVVTSSGPDDYAARDWPVMRPIHQAGQRIIYGSACYDYGLLAMGFLDVTVDATLAEHDFAAPEALIRNAGGACCDWRGAPLGAGCDGRVLMVGDPRLVEPCLELLGA